MESARTWTTRSKRQRARELRHEQTEAEGLLWERLRRNQLAGLHFRRQEPIAGLIADFYCHEAHVIVDADGSVHNTPEQKLYDAARDKTLAAYGIRVLRFTNAEIYEEIGLVLQRITAACDTESSL